LFVVLAAISPARHAIIFITLIAFGIVQVFEPRLGTLRSVILKLAFCYVLIYFSDKIASSFFLLLLLPVISAALTWGLRGMTVVTLIACVEYISFLFYINWREQYIDWDQRLEVALRILIMPLVGYLTYRLADRNRTETRKLAQANEQLREAESQLRRSERLVALGQLTAGLAHEVRNPLGTIKNAAELLARNVALQEDTVGREMTGYIATEVSRINSIMSRFLDFARPHQLRLQTEDLAAFLDHTIDRFENQNAGNAGTISVDRIYSPLPALAFDAELMEHVISNLLFNAAHASPPDGVVTIKTRVVRDTIEIAVSDHGSGIDPKNLESVFNPFFTTKSEGTGLGLAIVAKIVDEHGGRVTVDSKLGEGSVFRVYLPITSGGEQHAGLGSRRSADR
jgi:signal transduction histidine kinase